MTYYVFFLWFCLTFLSCFVFLLTFNGLFWLDKTCVLTCVWFKFAQAQRIQHMLFSCVVVWCVCWKTFWLKNNIQDHSCMSYICICETAITTTQHKAGGKTRTVFAFYMYDSRLINVFLCCRIRRKRWQKKRETTAEATEAIKVIHPN